MTAFNRLLAAAFGMTLAGLSLAVAIWLPLWMALFFTPAMLWLGWLLLADIVQRQDDEPLHRDTPVYQPDDGDTQTRRKLAA